jgi:hypothetical protein
MKNGLGPVSTRPCQRDRFGFGESTKKVTSKSKSHGRFSEGQDIISTLYFGLITRSLAHQGRKYTPNFQIRCRIVRNWTGIMTQHWSGDQCRANTELAAGLLPAAAVSSQRRIQGVAKALRTQPETIPLSFIPLGLRIRLEHL